MPDRQGVGDDTGSLAPVGIGKPALISINPGSQTEIIEVADNPVAADRRLEQLHTVLGEAALNQKPMERFEKSVGERMRPASAPPGSAMQHFQPGKKIYGFTRGPRLAQL